MPKVSLRVLDAGILKNPGMDFPHAGPRKEHRPWRDGIGASGKLPACRACHQLRLLSTSGRQSTAEMLMLI